MFHSVSGPLALVKNWGGSLANRLRRPTRRRPQAPSLPQHRRLHLAVESLENRVTPAASIIVASAFNSAVYQFNAEDGEYMATLVSFGTDELLALPKEDGTKVGPAGMTIGPDGNLYISSQANDKILKYDFSVAEPEDRLSIFIDTGVLNPIAVGNGVSTGEFAPAGLRFGPDGSLYVSMNGGRTAVSGGAVVRFSVIDTGDEGLVDLEYGGSFTIVANGLVQPTGMTFGVRPGDEDTLYVSNSGIPSPGLPAFLTPANIIKITDADGTSPSQSIFIPKNPSQAIYPSGLAFNTSGELFVVDLLGHKVVRYASNGTSLGVFTADPDNEGFLRFPSDALVVDADGNMLVANLGNNFFSDWDGFVSRFNGSGQPDEEKLIPGGPPPFGPSQLALLNDQPHMVSAGGPYTVAEGIDLVLHASASDPDGDPLTYSWDVNGDGVYGDAYGANPVVRWDQLQALGIDNGPSFFNVSVKVTDSHSAAVISAPVQLAVTNTPPTAIFSGPNVVSPGTPVTFTFSGQFDESAADRAAGFTYSYDFNNDGDFLDAGEAAGIPDASRSFTFTSLPTGLFTIRGAITDQNGGTRVISFTFNAVQNQSPTGDASNAGQPYIINEGDNLQLNGTASDPDVGDVLTVTWDLDGNGQYDDATGKGALVAWKKLKEIGIDDGTKSYPISMKVDDGKGNIIFSSATLTINNKAPEVANPRITSGLKEGQTATLVIDLLEPSSADNLTLTVNWGDGSAASVIPIAAITNEDGEIKDFSDPLLTHQYTRDGTFIITMTLKDKDGGETNYSPPAPPFSVVVANVDIIVAGQDKGKAGVKVLDAVSLTEKFTPLVPFGANYKGGYRVAVGDVTGDNVPDIIVASATANKFIKVFDGVTGLQVKSFRAFGAGQPIQGFNVAAADVNGDGKAEVIVGTGGGVAGRVKVFNVSGTPTVLANFLAYGSQYRKGVTVAAGNVNGGTNIEIVVAPQKANGAANEVKVYAGIGGGFISKFHPFGISGSNLSLWLAVGDLNGDQVADIAVSGNGRVRVFNGQNPSTLPLLADFTPYGTSFTGQVRVGLTDLDPTNPSDGKLDLLTASTQGNVGGAPRASEIKGWSITGSPTPVEALDDLFAYGNNFFAGTSVAGGGWTS